jgi:hypothetical protein
VSWREDGALGSDWADRYELLGNVNHAPPDRRSAIIRLASRLSIHPKLAAALIDSGVYDRIMSGDIGEIKENRRWSDATTDVWGKRGEMNKVPSWGWTEAARLVRVARALATASSIGEGLVTLGLTKQEAEAVAKRYKELRRM